MYLKKLEFNGFKSFAEKTELIIPPGITAIVGPNGCGKTNIVDAISWVLGEQSARQLRGLKMEDVIFNGSASRQPIGMAEVTLTFDNSDGGLPLDFSEVTFTRRVFRSGEGQYLINRKPCRLRDINELILGTGMGNRSYSLVGQGRIDQILRAPPEERRLLLEEAAGISKYRRKKEEAVRKLESTRNNLLRVDDIIKEVGRQLGVAERQARQAESYRKKRDRLRELEMTLSRLRLGEIRSREAALLKRRTDLEGDYKTVKKEVGDIENALFRLRNELREKEKNLNHLQTAKITAQAEIDKARHKIAVNEEQVRELEDRRGRLVDEVGSIQTGLAEGEKECRKLQKRALEIKEENSLKTARLKSEEDELDREQRKLSAAEKELSQGRDRILELSRSDAKIRNEFSGLEAGGKEMILRGRKLEVELEKIESEKKELQGEIKNVSANCQEARKKVRQLQEDLGRKEELRQQKEKELRSLSRQGGELELSFKEKQSRKEMVQNWGLLNGEDSDSRRIIMEELKKANKNLSGIIGPLTDLIEVRQGFEKAVEAALGENFYAFVVKKWADAVGAIQLLKRKKGGPARFIVLDLLQEIPRPAPSPEKENSGEMNILEYVKFIHPLDGPGEILLRDAVVVSDISRRGGTRSGTGKKILLTREGEVATPAGVIAWSGDRASPPELFSRQHHLKNLDEELKDILARVEKIRAREKEDAPLLKNACREVEDLKAEIHRQEMESFLKQSELERIEKNLERLDLNRQAVQTELASLREEQEKVTGRREELQVKLNLGTDRDQQLSEELHLAQRNLDELARKVRGREAELTELKIDLASSREKEEAINSRWQLLAAEVTDYRETLDSRKKSAEDSKRRQAELREENKRLNLQITRQLKDSEEKEKLIGVLEEEVKLGNRQYEEKEKAYQKIRPRLQESQGHLSDQDLLLTELRLKGEGICQKIRDKFKVELEAEELPADAPPPEVLEGEIERIGLRLERMTGINLGALEDKENFEKRHKLLQEQKQDLESAHAHIEEAIRKINATAREKLFQTFEVVRDNFRQIFARLFEGGKADLILDNEKNILESGLDIVAQPPGKKLLNISLLSGGEKALTTIALIFALFKVQPSPFYMLDEIDAPLDEANITRFVKLLKSLIKESQFVIITHNKRTISEANVLYGITMEESGVSKIVSVKFKD